MTGVRRIPDRSQVAALWSLSISDVAVILSF
jgi:hypothetical protein